MQPKEEFESDFGKISKLFKQTDDDDDDDDDDDIFTRHGSKEKNNASKFGQPNFLGDASGVCSYLGEKTAQPKWKMDPKKANWDTVCQI